MNTTNTPKTLAERMAEINKQVSAWAPTPAPVPNANVKATFKGRSELPNIYLVDRNKE